MDLGNGRGHLTYSTLVHPGDTWAEMWDSLNRFVPQVKARVSPKKSFGVSLRLSAFYFAHFVHGGGLLAYFPLYLAWRGLGAVEIAWVLALPQIARTFAPAAWGALADRTGSPAETMR